MLYLHFLFFMFPSHREREEYFCTILSVPMMKTKVHASIKSLNSLLFRRTNFSLKCYGSINPTIPDFYHTQNPKFLKCVHLSSIAAVTNVIPISNPTTYGSSRLSQSTIENKDGDISRAKVKMTVLRDARDIAQQAKSLYKSSMNSSNQLSLESRENIRKNWLSKEAVLADAYSKAIKYTAKLRTKDAAKESQSLLDEMIGRHDEIGEESNFLIGKDGPLFSEKSILSLVEAIEQDYWKISTSLLEVNDQFACKVRLSDIPPPDAKDFTNVLHSWASSKVRRKGMYAESLLYRMMELAYFYPDRFSMPDSKMFGLVIKCHAGSTCK